MYWYYFYHILLSIIFYANNISCETTNCVLSYYADEISYNNASSLNFYYTSVNVKSVDECANFCFHRQFCRIAVYNYFANTCSISYNWVINCRSYSKRYSQYQSPTRELVRIACIDSCKISITETQGGNDLRQIKNVLLKSGIEITHNTATSGEFKKGRSITIPQTNNENKFTTLETATTTTAYDVLLAATTATITTTTAATTITGTATTATTTAATIAATTTTTVTTTATTITSATTIPISTTNAERVRNVEGNISINDTVPVATARTTTNDDVPIEGIQLPHRTILQSFENETLVWLIYLQKLLEKNMHTYHSIIETFDSRGRIIISNPTFINDLISENNLHFLEEIAHELQENPDKYKVSVERTDDRQSWIVIHIGNYHKRENLKHETIFTNIPGTMHQFPARRDLPEELKANYHTIRIKLPYEFLNNSMSGKEKIQQKQGYTGSQNTSDNDVQRLNNHKEKLTFEKLPKKYIEDQHGYLYRIRIHDINKDLLFTNNITADHEMRQQEMQKSRSGKIENEDDDITGRNTSPTVNSFCFGMINRQLLYNASYKTLYDVSLEQCRCACAITWNDEDCAVKCKSFQYSNITRICFLNGDDHNGIFDLVYSWDTNYFYRICMVEDIVKDAIRNCPIGGKVKLEQIASEGINANWDTTISKNEANKTIHSTRKRSTIDHQSMLSSSTHRTQSVYWRKKSGKEEASKKAITEEVILLPGLWSKILKKKNDARNLKSLVLEIMKKESEEINDGTGGYQYRIEIRHGATTTTTTNTPYSNNREIQSTENSDLETIRESFAATKILTDYTAKTRTTKPLSYEEEVSLTVGLDGTSDDYSDNHNLNENDITTVSVTVAEGSSKMKANEKFEIPEADFEDASKTEQNSPPKAAENCFEVIDGFILKDTAGGLEQEVTLEECQCYCANSRINERYSFQCISATYYHNERDCILNLQTRNEVPDQFKRQDNVSYLGMICSVEDSKQQLVNIDLIDGCRRIVNISTSTTKPEIFTPVNTDNCFVEMPNHVLYGTAFAAETNVSVEECKCYCMNAEKQYGMECRSIEYYFDSRTCLLNNLSRTTNPKNFNHSIASRLMHSYFDKNCSTQNDEFLTYTKEKCLFVTNLAIVNTNSSLNFTNKIDSDRNAISQSDKVTSAYNNNNRDLTDGLVISKINLIHFTEYATPSNYDDLSQEVSKEEDKDKKSEKVSELQHSDLTTPHATTIIPANENFTDFTTISDSSSEPNNTTAILVTTTPVEMDYATSNQTFKKTTPSTEIATYPNLGKCDYSAIYQTSFRGTKLIKRILVSSPQQCFYGCHFEGCRSSNLIPVDNQTNSCELFSDALIDYRTSDVLVYDGGSVYFDGIKCTAKRRKVNDSSSENDNSIDNEETIDSEQFV